MAPPFCFVLIFLSHRSQCGATFMDSPFNACGMHAIITVRVIENNEIYTVQCKNYSMVPLHDRVNGKFYFISRDRK